MILSTDRPIERPAGPLLGTATVSIHTAPGRNPDTDGGPGRALAAKRGRFELLRVAQRLLYDRSIDRQPRTAWCHRTVTTKYGSVGVHRQGDGSGARFSGVMVCGMVWTCPVCAAKITELRRRELQAAQVNALAQQLHAYLLTLTFPHQDGDQLQLLLDRQAKALQRFKNSRTFKAFMATHQRAGSIRSLEVTYGLNGWHPHTHDLVFAAPKLLDDRRGLRQLKLAWIRALAKAGLYSNPDGSRERFAALWKHCLDVRGGDRAAEYIAKFGRDERWGISSEMTRPHAKIGMRRAIWSDAMHFTPFQLLEWARNGDASAARAFCEYAAAFEGKRMLSWSPGLKKRLRVAETEDQELAESPLPEESQVAQLTGEQYAVLLSRNALGEFLQFVAECCSDPGCAQADVDAYVAWLQRQRSPSHSDKVRRKSPLGELPGGYGVATYPAATAAL